VFARLYGVRRPRAVIDALAERLGVAPLLERVTGALSSGQLTRLNLCKALLNEPEVLFLDEPTASLDPTATRAVEEIISAIDLSGTKIIMTTHDLSQARRLADEIVFLHRGRLMEQRPAAEFFASPATAEAAAFIEGRLQW